MSLQVLHLIYDILIYGPTLKDHVVHLKIIFQVIRDQKLYLKTSKCCFATFKVKYLGHSITSEGVSTDSSKIQAVADWPQPSNSTQLREFLGLADIIEILPKILTKLQNL